MLRFSRRWPTRTCAGRPRRPKPFWYVLAQAETAAGQASFDQSGGVRRAHARAHAICHVEVARGTAALRKLSQVSREYQQPESPTSGGSNVLPH